MPEKLEKEYNALKSKEQEEQVELRRLRTENRLLRQRIDNLEKSNSASSSSSAEVVAGGVSDAEKVEKLTKQVAELKHWEQEAKACIRQLREKLRQVEHANRQLQADPKDEIQSCQEELIACKLREAEANLSMKELQQKVIELERSYHRYLEKQAGLAGVMTGVAKLSSKQQHQELKNTQDELMAVRLREGQVLSELKEMKQKVMELETQNHISDRHCKRLETEVNQLKEQLDEGDLRDKDLHAQIQELERKYRKIEEQKKEDEMMSRLKSAEHAQVVAEMRQRIAELEIENQEVMTAGALREKGSHEELTQKVQDLQEQVSQLKMARRLQSMSASMVMSTFSMGVGDTESDSDMEATIQKHALKLTDSMSLTTGMTLDDLNLRTSRAIDSGDSSDDERSSDVVAGEGKKVLRSARRKAARRSYDADKTPTQQDIPAFSAAIDNGLLNDEDEDDGDFNKTITDSPPPYKNKEDELNKQRHESVPEEEEETLSELESTCSHHTSLSSASDATSTTTNSTAGSSSGSSNIITASASKLHQIPEPVDV